MKSKLLSLVLAGFLSLSMAVVGMVADIPGFASAAYAEKPKFTMVCTIDADGKVSDACRHEGGPKDVKPGKGTPANKLPKNPIGEPIGDVIKTCTKRGGCVVVLPGDKLPVNEP